MRRRRVVLVPITLLVLASCSTASIPEAPGSDAVFVVGNGVCTISTLEDEVVDGVTVITERFDCETVSSDPRTSGVEIYPEIVSRITDKSRGGTWTAEGITLTNDEGVWRGTGHGAFDLRGDLPFAEGISPFNYGEINYVGEGAYEGLRLHIYISGPNEQVGLAGWIQPSE
jgi:hypothetical protein